MKNLEIGSKYIIHCYKHNGIIHRSWDEALLLDIKKDYLVFGNNKTRVINKEGKVWYTKEPAILYFYKNNWFNVIAQLKKTGIHYYCNIATPTVLEGKYIKYIDYDLDLRVFPDGSHKILDEDEYERHRIEMNYPEEINLIVKKELKQLIKESKINKGAFNKEEINLYYQKYLKMHEKA